jgi:hypothetical protein
MSSDENQTQAGQQGDQDDQDRRVRGTWHE